MPNNNNFLIAGSIFPLQYIIFVRVPLYVIAFYMADITIQGKIVNIKLFTSLSITLFVVMLLSIYMGYVSNYWLFIEYGIAAIPMMLLVCKTFELLPINFLPFFSFVGTISLETYLLQEILCNPIARFFSRMILGCINTSLVAILNLVITIISTWCLSQIVKRLLNIVYK